jgi:hypothetical protein
MILATSPLEGGIELTRDLVVKYHSNAAYASHEITLLASSRGGNSVWLLPVAADGNTTHGTRRTLFLLLVIVKI